MILKKYSFFLCSHMSNQKTWMSDVKFHRLLLIKILKGPKGYQHETAYEGVPLNSSYYIYTNKV